MFFVYVMSRLFRIFKQISLEYSFWMNLQKILLMGPGTTSDLVMILCSFMVRKLSA